MDELRATGRLTVYVVDDDAAVRDSIALLLGLAGHRVVLFADGESFLAAHRADWSGCVIADLRLPGLSGIDLQRELRERESELPVVIITAHGDVPTARQAFQARAVDFLEKPFDHEQLLAAIATAFAIEGRRIERHETRRSESARLAGLTPREREVLELVARGSHAREVGAALGISPRTVEVHRTRIMSKLGVRNLAELVRLTVQADREADAAEPPRHPAS